MHIRAERLLHLQTVIELLAAPLPGDELRRRLADPLLRLLEADFYASYAWDDVEGRFARGVGTIGVAGYQCGRRLSGDAGQRAQAPSWAAP